MSEVDYTTWTASELARAIRNADLNQLNVMQEAVQDGSLPEREQLLAGMRQRATAIRASITAQVQEAQEHDDLIRKALQYLKD